MPKVGHRFFFTHCKLQQPQKAGKASRAARAAGAGSWHSQGSTDVVDAAGVKVGEMRKLRYRKGGAYTDWLMDEFSTTLCSEDAASAAGDKQFVLCNIYVSPRAAPDSAARRESAAFFAPPAPVVIPQQAEAAAATKRPAPPQIAVPPCPKRMRGAVVAPIPPVLQPAGYPSFAPPRPYTAASAPPPPPLVPTRLAAPPPSPPVPTSFATPPPSVPTRFATAPPPPVPTRLAATPPVPTCFAMPPPPPIRSPAPAPPQPRQQMPLPAPPLVRACCHIPVVHAPARNCPPQPSEKKTKQRMLDPFEAAEVSDEEEDDLKKCLEDDAEGSAMTADEVEQHFASLWED
ncbi:unnamed protein product [Urochloa decumbens]|uniref:NAC domain-containing protein n=1 Tax=Urochloa decumbens TaxID=240449 RepID=A0ABC9FU32_9POAL